MRTFPSLLVLVAALVFAPAAHAGTIVFFDSSRHVGLNGDIQQNNSTGFWSAFDSFSDFLVFQQVFHVTWVGDLRADAQGHPYYYTGNNGSVNARSTAGSSGPIDAFTDLFTSFSIDAPFSADLDFFLSATEGDSFTRGFLFDQTTQTMLAELTLTSGSGRLAYEGILAPGIYSLGLLTAVRDDDSFYNGRGQFTGDLQLREFTPVPEPGTMTLFGVGLAAAAWRRRRR